VNVAAIVLTAIRACGYFVHSLSSARRKTSLLSAKRKLILSSESLFVRGKISQSKYVACKCVYSGKERDPVKSLLRVKLYMRTAGS
jgi:hypothetical protein